VILDREAVFSTLRGSVAYRLPYSPCPAPLQFCVPCHAPWHDKVCDWTLPDGGAPSIGRGGEAPTHLTIVLRKEGLAGKQAVSDEKTQLTIDL
jgi:hypothetical protein